MSEQDYRNEDYREGYDDGYKDGWDAALLWAWTEAVE
jgi:hypothetical protein